MPPKKKVTLPDHVRIAALIEVETTYRQTLKKDEDLKLQIWLKSEQGLTMIELAEHLKGRGLDVSQQTLSRWSREGKEIYERRESARDQQLGGDPVRPGELEPLG